MMDIKEKWREWKEKIEKQYENVVNDFPDLKSSIKYLIRYRSGKYAIFIDKGNDLDWETDDSIDDLMVSNEISNALSKIEHLQHQPCIRYFTYKQKEDVYCLLGEGLAYAIEGFYKSSDESLNKAEQYIDDRKYEITRKWQLLYSLVILVAFIIIFLFLIKYFVNICNYFGLLETETYKLLFCFWGVVGAVFSIIQNTGNTFYDCQSGRLLNFLQIFSKIMAGMISSVFVVHMYEVGLIFSSMGKNNESACLTILCMVSGFSERLVPSLINKLCENETKEEKNE